MFRRWRNALLAAMLTGCSPTTDQQARPATTINVPNRQPSASVRDEPETPSKSTSSRRAHNLAPKVMHPIEPVARGTAWSPTSPARAPKCSGRPSRLDSLDRQWCVVVVLAAILAGCSPREDRQTWPTNSSSPTSQSTTTSTGQPTTSNGPGGSGVPKYGAPKIVTPLEPGPYLQDPCRLVTEAQAKQLGVPWPGKKRQGVVAPACDWVNLDTGAHIGLQFETATKRGLSKAYELRGSYDYFIEIPSIEGVPAVAFGNRLDKQAGDCQLWVGVTDEVVFLLSGSLSYQNRQQGKDPCQAVQAAAGTVLRTMKGET